MIYKDSYAFLGGRSTDEHDYKPFSLPSPSSQVGTIVGLLTTAVSLKTTTTAATIL